MRLMKLKVNKIKLKKIISLIVGIILLISICLNLFLILKYNILPFKFLIIFIILFGFIPLLLIFLTIFKRQKPIVRKILLSVEFIFILILFVVFFYLNKTFNFLDDFTSNYNYETKNYYVLVNKDSDYSELENLENKKIGYFRTFDESIGSALEKIDEKVNIQHEEIDGFSTVLNKLYNEEIDSILIIQSYYDMMTESDETIKENTKILYEFSIREKVNSITKDSDVLNDTFFVYISGIDTFGSVTEKTRSDVNIVMGINPKTHQIMMINIPRDYYVTLHGINQKDKLTHAGIYGVEMSTKTIENLLDIEINYYVKLNFNAVIKTVDALGGVEVYSNHDFYSTEYSHHFIKGYNKVDGELALDFVRTRKAFLDGDRVRGENQEAMIQAIIDKAISPAILTKYDDILDTLEGCFTTNMPTEKIMEFVKMQLDKMPNWNITSLGLNGSDSYNYTYTYGSQELYVMVPNEKTIEVANKTFDDLKSGKILDDTYKQMMNETIHPQNNVG